jgi:ligand-binding sensor domain-containing protein
MTKRTCIPKLSLKNRFKTVVICCVLGFFSANAQLQQDLKITNFDGATGFYSRVVSSILKDDKGFLWIGTSDGLYRYDGYSFRNYKKLPNDSNSLADNNITQLAFGTDHKIWMGMSMGVISSFRSRIR